MKEIAFDSLLLIAADDVSQQAINQLRSDGIIPSRTVLAHLSI
mgnify:CR=1 FL=1